MRRTRVLPLGLAWLWVWLFALAGAAQGQVYPPGQGYPAGQAHQPAPAGPAAQPRSASLALAVGSTQVRVIDAYPGRLAPLGEEVLANFDQRVALTPDGVLRLQVSGPVIVEEHPFSPLRLRNNPRFGATMAGQVNLALRGLRDDELDARQRRITEMISLAGVGIARDFQSYDTRRVAVEHQPGSLDYAKADQGVRLAGEMGVAFIGRLGLHAGPRHQEGPIQDEAAYMAYADRTVRRYQDQVRIWSGLKEPFPGARLRPGHDPGLTPEQAVRALQLSYQAVKAVDPALTVYFPGTGPFRHPQYTMESYLEELVALGAPRFFDVLGYDAYVFDIVEAAESHRRLLARHGYARPLWAAQTGAPDQPAPSHLPFRGGGSPQAQAEFLARAYVRAFAHGVERVFWGEFLDRSRGEFANRGNFWESTGLFYTGTWEAKPAYHTHRLLASALDGFSGVETIAENVFRFTFPDRSPLYVLWP